MFFFKSVLNKAFRRNALRRNAQFFFTQKALVLMLMFCLSTALLFNSCNEGGGSSVGVVDDRKFNIDLIGTWNSPLGDGYTISSNKITYDDGGYGNSYAGTIKYFSNFTGNAGVIIIEYDEDSKPSYWEYDNDWNPVTELPLKGNFIGVYYKNLKSGSVSMGVAYSDGGAEEATLDAAKKTFTMGNEGKYINYYGEYSK